MAIYEILIVGAASSRDDSYKATFFRGWKPLPREIDVILMTLTHDLLKFHTRCRVSGVSGRRAFGYRAWRIGQSVKRRSQRELISECGLRPIGAFAYAPAGMRKE
jgi:hypothetical protein